MVLLDAGDMFSQTKKPAELRAQVISKSMGLMKYDAINLSDEELGLGCSFFTDQVKKNNLNIVSANVGLASDTGDKKIVKPFVVKDFKGFKVGITGVTPQTYFKLKPEDKSAAVFSKDMTKDLSDQLEIMNKQADFIIVLTHLGYDAAASLLEMNDLKGVSLAVAGHGRKTTENPKKIKDAFLVQSSSTGEHIGVMKIKLDDKNKPVSASLEDVILKLELPEDQEIVKIAKEFELEAAKLEEEERKKAESAEDQAALKEILKLKPEEFVKKMQGHEGQTVPLK